MKPYALPLMLLVVIGAAFAGRSGSVPEARNGASARSAPPGTLPPSAVLPPSPPPTPRLSRNPFEYAEREAVPDGPLPAVKAPRPVPSPAESASTPRLVGFLRQGAALKVVLSVRGEVFVLAVGDEGGGYTVVAADEERGARLLGPDRSEVDLKLPGASES